MGKRLSTFLLMATATAGNLSGCNRAPEARYIDRQAINEVECDYFVHLARRDTQNKADNATKAVDFCTKAVNGLPKGSPKKHKYQTQLKNAKNLKTEALTP